MTKIALFTSASLIALATVAQASDLPSKKKAPAIAPASAAANWTGCYAGLNGGFVSQSTDTTYEGTDEGSHTGRGAAVGGQMGCDYQSGNVVFGVQGLVDWTNASGSNDYTDNEGGVLTTDARWFATLTGRLGYTVQPETLIYVKGGAAWMNNDYTDVNNDLGTVTGSHTSTGWLVGAGLEHKLSSNMSLFAEYNYMDFGSDDVALTGDDNWTNSYSNTANLFLMGVNYRF